MRLWRMMPVIAWMALGSCAPSPPAATAPRLVVASSEQPRRANATIRAVDIARPTARHSAPDGSRDSDPSREPIASRTAFVSIATTLADAGLLPTLPAQATSSLARAPATFTAAAEDIASATLPTTEPFDVIVELPATRPTNLPAAVAPAETGPTTAPSDRIAAVPASGPATPATQPAETARAAPARAVSPRTPALTDFDADPAPHPLLDGSWPWGARIWVAVVALFAAAAVIGPMVRATAPQEIPPAQSHDEPPGASHHHGFEGLSNRQQD